MPSGHQVTEAYPTLEQSSKDPSTFKPRKNLSHHGAGLGISSTTDPASRSTAIATSRLSSSSRKPNGIMPSGSYLVNGHGSGLPPTPPRNSHDKPRSNSYRANTGIENGTGHMARKKSPVTTPINQQSPPTPDATPPATAALGISLRDQPSRITSSPYSRAESFKTAREEQSSSEGEERERNDEAHIRGDQQGEVKPVCSTGQDTGLGLEFERDDDSSTPTQRKIRILRLEEETDRSQANGRVLADMDAIPDREWDTNLMRNVTVRRKKRLQMDPNKVEEDEARIAARSIVPKLVNGSSEDEDASEPQTPSQEQFGQVIALPKTQPLDEHSKRLSNSSHTSTILEAIVIATPPPRRRTLRHVSRNLSLRSSDGGSLVDVSPITSSNRTSLTSEELSKRRLSHKRGSISSDENGRNESRSVSADKPIAQTVPLKHHEGLPLRADAETLNDQTIWRTSEGTHSMSTISSHSGSFSSGDLFGASTRMQSRGRYSTGSSLGKRLSREESVKYKYDASVTIPQRADSTTARHNSPTRAATRRALRKLEDPSPLPILPTLRSTSPVRYPQDSVDPTPSDSVVTVRRVEVAAEAESQPEQPSIESTMPASEAGHSSALQNGYTIESIPRVSFDRSTVGTHEIHRTSNASSTLRADEHALARHLFAQTTPFSQVSDPHDPLEVSEATAVSIFPHNNNSLLVVQQVARPSGVQKQLADQSEIPGWPTLTVQPATPPQQIIAPANVDSPLKNPRQPPRPPQPTLMPPVINILPATPADELDELSLESPLMIRSSHPPTRAQNLVQRARRYSDSVMRPILNRSETLRRSYYRRSRDPRPGASRKSNVCMETEEYKQADSKLHPFWQPRGFWDDFSDSDSEVGEPEPEDESRARLPPGGDTTDLGEPRGFARVFDGLRSGRGFLIGNSLGLERAGTNRRTPRIEMPVGLGQRASGKVMRRMSEGTLRSMRSHPPPRIDGKMLGAERVVKNKSSTEEAHKTHKGKRKAWNPRYWQVQYIGVGGMRDLWREKQTERRREKLRSRIGIRYVVEGAPVRN